MVEPQTRPVPRRERGSAWHWLLIVPVVVPLLVFLYNGKNPYLLGFPRFYWLQLAFILLGVCATTLVYQLTKRRGAGRGEG
jgi:predicted ferric reductase